MGRRLRMSIRKKTELPASHPTVWTPVDEPEADDGGRPASDGGSGDGGEASVAAAEEALAGEDAHAREGEFLVAGNEPMPATTPAAVPAHAFQSEVGELDVVFVKGVPGTEEGGVSRRAREASHRVTDMWTDLAAFSSKWVRPAVEAASTPGVLVAEEIRYHRYVRKSRLVSSSDLSALCAMPGLAEGEKRPALLIPVRPPAYDPEPEHAVAAPEAREEPKATERPLVEVRPLPAPLGVPEPAASEAAAVVRVDSSVPFDLWAIGEGAWELSLRRDDAGGDEDMAESVAPVASPESAAFSPEPAVSSPESTAPEMPASEVPAAREAGAEPIASAPVVTRPAVAALEASRPVATAAGAAEPAASAPPRPMAILSDSVASRPDGRQIRTIIFDGAALSLPHAIAVTVTVERVAADSAAGSSPPLPPVPPPVPVVAEAGSETGRLDTSTPMAPAVRGAPQSGRSVCKPAAAKLGGLGDLVVSLGGMVGGLLGFGARKPEPVRGQPADKVRMPANDSNGRPPASRREHKDRSHTPPAKERSVRRVSGS